MQRVRKPQPSVPSPSSVVILARFVATWALSAALLGVVVGPGIGILAGVIVAVVYWATACWTIAVRCRSPVRSAKRIRIATLSQPARRPIHDR